MDAGRRAGVLRVDAQADLAFVVGLGLGDDLNRGALLLRLLGDVAVAEVLPQPAVAGDGLEGVEPLGRQPGHAGLLGVAVGHVGPAGLVLVLGPEQVLGLVADGVELLLDIEVELERVGGERLLDLLLAVEGLGGVAGHVQRLGRELRRPAGALDREEDLVEQVEDGGVEVLLVGLLLASQGLRAGDGPWGCGRRPSARRRAGGRPSPRCPWRSCRR